MLFSTIGNCCLILASHYQQANPLGLVGLFHSLSSACLRQKENEASTSAISQNSVSNHESIPSIEELTLRLKNLRNDRTPPSLRELNQRYQNLKRKEASTSYADIETKLKRIDLYFLHFFIIYRIHHSNFSRCISFPFSSF